MPTAERQLYLLAYDIADPRRLGRVHRCLKRWGLPLQYSVWLVPVRRAQLDELQSELQALIRTDQDDVRIYALPAGPEVICRGCPRYDPGVLLLGQTPVDLAMAAFLSESSAAA